jgi:hypothetical protein
MLDRARAFLAFLVVTSPVWGIALAVMIEVGLPDLHLHPTMGTIVWTVVLAAIGFRFWKKASSRARRILVWSLAVIGTFCALGVQFDIEIVVLFCAFLTWSAPVWGFFLVAYAVGYAIDGIIADLKDRR